MGKKIRILHIAQAAGGVDIYLKTLLKYMDTNKFENILVASQDYKKADYKQLVFAYETVEMNRTIGEGDFKAVLIIRKIIKKFQPDIIYAHSSKAGALARLANMGIHNKCIYNPHGWAFNMQCSKKKKILYALIEKLEAPFSDKIICISEAERQSALKYKICKDKKLQVIYNGIDIESYDQNSKEKIAREKLQIPKDAFVVGMVGRVSLQKAPDIFIRSARLIKNVIPNAYFIIVGNGEMEEEILKYVKEHNLEQSFLLTGWVSNPTDYIEQFDIAMLLSRWEGFGLVLPEYMIEAKPIIATRVDAIPYIIKDRENGLLVDGEDIEAVCKAVLELYENKNLRGKLVNNGLKVVREKFDARRMVDEYQMFFTNLIG